MASAKVTLNLLELTLLCDADVRADAALTWLAKLSLLCEGRPEHTPDCQPPQSANDIGSSE